MKQRFRKIMKNSDNVWWSGVISGACSYYGTDPFIPRMIVLIFAVIFPIQVFLVYIIISLLCDKYDANYDMEIERENPDLVDSEFIDYKSIMDEKD